MVNSRNMPRSRSKSPKRRASPKRRQSGANKAKTTINPTTLKMVEASIAAMKDKKGSSVQSIKKYIMANYKGIPANRLNAMIRQALTKGVTSGALVRPKASTSTGSTGRFRVGKATSKTKAKPKKKKTPKKNTLKRPKSKKPKNKKGSSKSNRKSPKKSKTAKRKAPKTKKVSRPKAKVAKPAKKTKKPAKKPKAKRKL